MSKHIASLLILMSATASLLAQNQRDLAVREDKLQLQDDASWVYDDLEAAVDEADRSRRPLMVVFR